LIPSVVKGFESNNNFFCQNDFTADISENR